MPFRSNSGGCGNRPHYVVVVYLLPPFILGDSQTVAVDPMSGLDLTR